MQAFTVHQGLVVPLDRSDVDTDQIIPKQFLKSIRRSGFGANLFDEWRYLDRGEPGQDSAQRVPNPDFVLNQTRYRGASILLARRNFGCGSSREHAPWAIAEYGLRALIAPSFADIFYGNCLKNGLLPVRLAESVVDSLFQQTTAQVGYCLTVDLVEQVVRAPGGSTWHFAIDGFQRQCLLNAWDEVALTLRHADAIGEFEQRRLQRFAWLARGLSA